MTLRTELFLAVVGAHVPEPPARLLEVGCGRGELALALAEHGYEITAIDPQAPDGPIFQRVALEEFSDERGFDAVVASLSLHHVHDLGGALDKLASLLPPGGPLVLDEWATERFAGATVRWWYEQRRTLASVGRTESAVPDDFAAWVQKGRDDRAGLHHASIMLTELEKRFVQRSLEWHPYLYSWLLDDTLLELERALIEEGAIDAVGLWYVGVRR